MLSNISILPGQIESHAPYLRLIEVYLVLGQRWRLQHFQKQAHDLPHIIRETLKT